MWLPRINSKGMANNKFWYDKYWNKGAGTVNGMANCTCCVIGLINENSGRDTPLSLFKPPYQSPGAFPNAKDFMKYWKGETGTEPRIGSVVQWDGTLGHVAYVLDTKDAGSKGAWVKVAQSNFGGVYFEVKEYYVKVGKVTEGVGLKYSGCCYVNIEDMRTTRNKNLLQVEVLTDSLNARMTPNGIVYSGRRVAQGIYTIFDRMSAGDYVWAQLDNDTWIALNDEDGWTRTYEIEKMSYDALMSAYEALSQKYTDLVMRYEKETGKKA